MIRLRLGKLRIVLLRTNYNSLAKTSLCILVFLYSMKGFKATLWSWTKAPYELPSHWMNVYQNKYCKICESHSLLSSEYSFCDWSSQLSGMTTINISSTSNSYGITQWIGGFLYLRWVGGDVVENIDENKEESYKQGHPTCAIIFANLIMMLMLIIIIIIVMVIMMMMMLIVMMTMAKVTWYNVRGYKEGDPWDDNKKAGRQIVGDDVRHHVPLQCLQCADHHIIWW